MNLQNMKKIFEDTAYIRTGGSAEELRCAEYIAEKCKKIRELATYWLCSE